MLGPRKTAALPRCGEQARTQSAQASTAAVLENADLVAAILGHAELGPFAFVAMGRVAKAWHAACRLDATLLLAAAQRPDFLTKHTLRGLFALHWHEADKLPRGKRARRNGGWLYMYSAPAIERALPIVGGLDGWRRRIAARASREKAAVTAAEQGGWAARRRRRGCGCGCGAAHIAKARGGEAGVRECDGEEGGAQQDVV